MFDNLVSRFKMLAKQTFSFILILSLAQAGRVKRMESSIIEVNGKLGMYLVRHYLVNKCITRWRFRSRFFIPSNQTFPEASESQQTL